MSEEKELHWQKTGSDPDYRFSLANERTFLAWIRTALALLAGALVLSQFSSSINPGWVHHVLGIAIVMFAVFLSIGAYFKWRGNELAMRHAKSLPVSVLLPLTAASMVALSVVVGILILVPTP